MKKVTVTYVSIEDFFEFLTQNKCTLAFLRNFLAYREGVEDGNVVDWLVEVFKSDPEKMIASSFVWSRTPEGSDYWTSLDSKWRGLFEGSEGVEVYD